MSEANMKYSLTILGNLKSVSCFNFYNKSARQILLCQFYKKISLRRIEWLAMVMQRVSDRAGFRPELSRSNTHALVIFLVLASLILNFGTKNHLFFNRYLANMSLASYFFFLLFIEWFNLVIMSWTRTVEEQAEGTKGKVAIDVETIGVSWWSSGWEGAGGVKMSQNTGSLRTILPFYIIYSFQRSTCH